MGFHVGTWDLNTNKKYIQRNSYISHKKIINQKTNNFFFYIYLKKETGCQYLYTEYT